VDKIVHASFINAKNYGFTDKAIAAACCDLNLPSVTGSILPNGPYDIVTFAQDHWMKEMREDLVDYTKMNEEELLVSFKDLSPQDKLKAGIRSRLEIMSPYVEVWPQAMLLGLKPTNLVKTAGKLHEISDELWFLAGDRSTDITWYTKRSMLTKVYIATEVFML
jgi:ubiquinone biosynthesis protein COQ9